MEIKVTDEEIVNPCPCGRGTYTEYIDRSVGFREHVAYFQCKRCNNKYDLVKMGYHYYPILKEEVKK